MPNGPLNDHLDARLRDAFLRARATWELGRQKALDDYRAADLETRAKVRLTLERIYADLPPSNLDAGERCVSRDAFLLALDDIDRGES
jgi:hypothetical protein